MTIDFYCREDLVITTLKEFFEIFISSVKRDESFHNEVLNSKYCHIGLNINFEMNNSSARLNLILGGASSSVPSSIQLPDNGSNRSKLVGNHSGYGYNGNSNRSGAYEQ
jgi:hypothetical protein